jgi:hypothetical protein
VGYIAYIVFPVLLQSFEVGNFLFGAGSPLHYLFIDVRQAFFVEVEKFSAGFIFFGVVNDFIDQFYFAENIFFQKKLHYQKIDYQAND